MKCLVSAVVAALVMFLSERAYGDSEQNRFAVVSTIHVDGGDVTVSNFDFVTDQNVDTFRVTETIYGYRISDGQVVQFSATLIDRDQGNEGLSISRQNAMGVLDAFGIGDDDVFLRDYARVQSGELSYIKQDYMIRHQQGDLTIALAANDPIPWYFIAAGIVIRDLLGRIAENCDAYISLNEVIQSRGTSGWDVVCG